MIVNQNRGMYTETIINNTILWYLNHQIAFFSKNYLPISINHYSKISHEIKGKITQKSSVDYRGIYQGQYIEFEVKETEKSSFSLNQLKKHQFYHLQVIQQYGGISFLLVNFLANEAIFLILTKQLQKLKLEKVKNLSLALAQKIGYQLPIIFPGIIDWIAILKQNKVLK